eukprot:22583-Prymnesium_polylepis.1
MQNAQPERAGGWRGLWGAQGQLAQSGRVGAACAAVVAVRHRRLVGSPGLRHDVRAAGAWRRGAGPMPGAPRD